MKTRQERRGPRPATKRPEQAPAPRNARRAGPQRKELKYYGRAACEALFRARPQDIIRVYLEQELIPAYTPLLKWAATERKAYHVVTATDLEKLTESVHHQGIAILARERLPLEFEDLRGRLRAAPAGPQLLAYLDGVENPHNLGAIVRTCAHFGVHYVLGARNRLPRLSPSACRVAEGGAEAVELVMLDQPLADLAQLGRDGFRLIATAVNRGSSLYQFRFPERAVLVLGAEVEGISATVEQAATVTLRIPGTGGVESLNVGVAFGVMAGEFYRQRINDQ
jgi:TrmH RNA methyltransferase